MSYLRTCKKKILYFILLIISLVLLLHPARHGHRDFDYISKEIMSSSLHEELAKNFTSTATRNCDYLDAIYDEVVFSPSVTDSDLVENHRILEGGEYMPAECKPKYSTAIIVPYRDRAEHLRGFLIYMHTFLRRQKIHYRIYVVEQVDTKPFNKARLVNIGAKAAIHAGYPCLVLHDVDLLPLRPANLYACTEQPRHMSACINTMRFVLPSLDWIGGAVAMITKQFKDVNGATNDHNESKDKDSLYSRLQTRNLNMCRFEPDTSAYYRLEDPSITAGTIQDLHKETLKTTPEEGFNSLQYKELVTVLHPLFTHLVVDF